MEKWIKNNDSISRTWVGQSLTPGEYYLIPKIDESDWSSDDEVLTDIANGKIIVAKSSDGTTDIASVSTAISYLNNDLPSEVNSKAYPFAEKTVDGKKIYSRVTGKSFSLVVGNNDLLFAIPYPQVKINGLEIINPSVGDHVTLKILDSAAGTYTTVPNLELNIFGDNVYISKDYYERMSNYDADLFQGMQVKIEYHSVDVKDVYVNYIIHELKDS